MKAGKEHRVPCLIQRSPSSSRFMNFASPISSFLVKLRPAAFEHGVRETVGADEGDEFTPHGFRSAFRDWAGDETSFLDDVAEQALAHHVGDATERPTGEPTRSKSGVS